MDLIDKIKIVPALNKDLSRIANVFSKTLRGDFEYGKRSFEENVSNFFRDVIQSNYQQVYIAKKDNEVMGVAYFNNLPPNNEMCWLEMFAVGVDYQKKGIGLKLVKTSCDMFVEQEKQKGINLKTIALTTNKANSRAQTLYNKAGFIISEDYGGEIRGFVGKGNIEVVMIKPIGNSISREENTVEKFDGYKSPTFRK